MFGPTKEVETNQNSHSKTSKPKSLNPDEKGPSPQELRKIQKDKRRKQYEDIQVQNTNNSSIVSKRSVEMIYKSVSPPGEWFKYFVPKGKRRSPAINRGYWIRMESIRQLIYRIIHQHQGCSVNVVNLGCGFDPLPFQLLSMEEYGNVNFYDIDYPDLVNNKKQMILQSNELQGLIGSELSPDEQLQKLGWILNYKHYKLLGCDLRNHQLYQQQLQQIAQENDRQGNNTITIFIAEVSLAYMHFNDANRIIHHSSQIANSHFVILEQIIPSGDKEAFTKKMLNHFNKLRSSLKCVEEYPTLTHQYNRFKQYYPQVEIQNLFENWNQLVDDSVKEEITKIEDFDEWEEFILFCQHYIITHATNTNALVYEKSHQEYNEETMPMELNMVNSDIPLMDLKFPASCWIGNSVFTVGGLQQFKTNNMYKNGVLVECQNPEVFTGRMCHSFTAVSHDTGIVIGGRTKPNQPLHDIYLFNVNEKRWSKMHSQLQYPVYRHQVVQINSEEVMIIGGQEHLIHETVMVYNWVSDKLREVEITGDFKGLNNLKSFGISFVSGKGYIIGGITHQVKPEVNDKLVEFTVNEQQNQLHCRVVDQKKMYQRVDCKLASQNNEKLMVIGGINYNQHLGQDDIFLQLQPNLSAKVEVSKCQIPGEIWENTSPILIGFNVVTHDNKIEIIAGGVVCYSFGSVYNFNYTITW